jgi:hypothetical protein
MNARTGTDIASKRKIFAPLEPEVVRQVPQPLYCLSYESYQIHKNSDSQVNSKLNRPEVLNCIRLKKLRSVP